MAREAATRGVLCPALLCPALLCPALLCPALLCPALLCPALFCPALLCPALLCPALFCPALFCPALFCLALFCPALLCPALLCPAVFCPAVFCPALFCSVIRCSAALCSPPSLLSSSPSRILLWLGLSSPTHCLCLLRHVPALLLLSVSPLTSPSAIATPQHRRDPPTRSNSLTYTRTTSCLAFQSRPAGSHRCRGFRLTVGAGQIGSGRAAVVVSRRGEDIPNTCRCNYVPISLRVLPTYGRSWVFAACPAERVAHLIGHRGLQLSAPSLQSSLGRFGRSTAAL